MRTPPERRCMGCNGQLVTTDDVGTYECTTNGCQQYNLLYATNHAEYRWDKRSENNNVDIVEAFERGVELDDRHELAGNEFRYYHPTRTILIRKDVGITTVINVINAERSNKEAVIRTSVTELQDPEMTGQLCGEMGFTTEQFRAITRDLRDNAGARSGKRSGQTATRNTYSDQSASGGSS